MLQYLDGLNFTLHVRQRDGIEYPRPSRHLYLKVVSLWKSTNCAGRTMPYRHSRVLSLSRERLGRSICRQCCCPHLIVYGTCLATRCSQTPACRHQSHSAGAPKQVAAAATQVLPVCTCSSATDAKIKLELPSPTSRVPWMSKLLWPTYHKFP